MVVGMLKEIKESENWIALTPAGGINLVKGVPAHRAVAESFGMD